MEHAYDRSQYHELIRQALAEDIGPGDVTSAAVLKGDETGIARALAKSEMVTAGLFLFAETFRTVDNDLHVRLLVEEGTFVPVATLLAEIGGNLAAILAAERTALNFLQRLSGIATLTRRFVEAVAGTKARILDTRKTAPGLRLLDKYAVRAGGGGNHRFALFDGVLIKDNHIAAAGGIATAVARARANAPHTARIEVEVRTLAEVEEALRAGADVLMLDNMSTAQMRDAVTLIGGRTPVEASGNMTLERVREVAETGVDYISVGALTHSVVAADISLLVETVTP